MNELQLDRLVTSFERLVNAICQLLDEHRSAQKEALAELLKMSQLAQMLAAESGKKESVQ